MPIRRAADPYRDLDVIDSRAPRFNQATIGLLAVLAVVTGWWWLLALLSLQLVVGLTFGRRYCLPCLAYFELVRRRHLGGRVRDGRRGPRQCRRSARAPGRNHRVLHRV